tara:strand:- start:53 stop:391 length:339 start_codon:yes stop_codon:yes gene_type:complete
MTSKTKDTEIDKARKKRLATRKVSKKNRYKRKPNLKERLVRKFHKAIGNENRFTNAIGLEEGELVDKQAEAHNKIFGRDMYIERAKELENLEKFGVRPNLLQLNKKKKKRKK